LDTLTRPVYLDVDKRPERMESLEVMRIFLENNILEGLTCCAKKAWIVFVVEADSSLSNIQVCSEIGKKSAKTNIEKETNIFNARVKDIFVEIKLSPAMKDGKMVAHPELLEIDLECD